MSFDNFEDIKEDIYKLVEENFPIEISQVVNLFYESNKIEKQRIVQCVWFLIGSFRLSLNENFSLVIPQKRK